MPKGKRPKDSFNVKFCVLLCENFVITTYLLDEPMYKTDIRKTLDISVDIRHKKHVERMLLISDI